MNEFVHLHVHTEYSLLDGAARIAKLIKTCKEMGMPAVAMTDHGNMYGAIHFYKACKKEGIKPIIGCEFYVVKNHLEKSGRDNCHLVLLAKNDDGYHNLCKLSAASYVEGFYGKPRIDHGLLEKYHEGLVCLSACLAGELPQMILENRYEEAEATAKWYKDLFGEDYYIELQNHGLKEQYDSNPKLREIAKKLGIKTVATNDVHYIYKEDALLQDVLMCVNMAKFYDDPNRLKFPCDEFYLKSYDEMLKALPNDKEALETTLEIADKCNFDFVFGHYLFPRYLPETGQDPVEFIRDLINAGIKEKYGKETPELRDRIEHEMKVIQGSGFVEYYLIVWDYINAARNMGVPVGPGRGSGAGSVVAYLIGITDIDPLKYDLLFERFLNPERVSAPDFDVDFADDTRYKVIDYVRKKYGDERVIKIITFGKMAGKCVIKDVARVLRMPYAEVDRITKLMPDEYKRPFVIKKCFGMHIPKEGDKDFGKTYGVAELIEMYNTSDAVKRVIDIAIKLEDTPRNCSTHACGVVIGAERLDKHIPLSRNGDDITTQFEMGEIEELGHLKMDFLGLRNLNDIAKCCKYVKENYDIDVNFRELGYEDPEVYKLIATGNTKAIFQIESGGFQKFMKDLKPTGLEDIVAGVSLYRPGPMDSIPRYVQNKHHPEGIKYDHPILEHVLDVTYGCIVYQEQVMRIVQDLAGYTLGRADSVRKMMGKKKVEAMREEKKVFLFGTPAANGKAAVDGAIKRGVPQDVAEKIWGQMETFAQYAFNKSHAAAYSLITYQTAYLKTYYEPEFLTAVLNNRITNADEIKNYVNYAKQEKIEVLPPNINKSNAAFSIKDGKIRFGISALKGVGEAVCEKIVEERNTHGEFKDLEDFLKRTCEFGINKRMLESFIFSGTFDCFKQKRSVLASVYENALDRVNRDRKNRLAGQLSLFEDESFSQDMSIGIDYPDLPELENFQKLKREKEVIGIYLSGHPLDSHLDTMASYTFNSSMLAQEDDEEEDMIDEEGNEVEKEFVDKIEDKTQVICGGLVSNIHKVFTKTGNKPMAIVEIEDLYGTFEVMFFNKVYEQNKDQLQLDKFVTISGKYSSRGGERPIVLAEKASFWSTEEKKHDTKPSVLSMAERSSTNSSLKLFLKFNLQDSQKTNEVFDILRQVQGDTAVFVQSEGKLFDVRIKTMPTKAMMGELKLVLGDDNIKIK